ncbi:ubiquitin-associated protein 2 isoform X3 [Carassius gibelio]|uniref:ubiquitin-associated protein 2 isoform X3 n=1 Tax=Carassius gibelio TaxID=101364 RepID=UPI0022784453|nr:ubiquitin-associated protein 2 isoform X3 [Carassius gibelio]
MMTSVVTDAARGNRDRALPKTTHTSQSQKQIQATAEQIRLAQMIYDKNDADFEGKVQQLMEVTGKNQDECMVALHDCNGDVTRAINFLLEEVTVKDSWETVGKKKSVGKEGTAPESREKRGEREGRGRGGPNRRGRGASHSQEGRSEENGFDSAPGERGGDRGRRGRGRGVGSRGRGRGAGMSRLSQGTGRMFNPADCTGSVEAGEAGNETTEGAGAWKESLEDWAAEDWNEDLSETKVFTASYALGSKNHVQPGQGMDLGSLLPKVAEGDSELSGLEPSSPDTLTQSLVFTNSQQHATRTHTHSYASAAAGTYAHAASSMLGSRLPQNDVQKMEPISTPRTAPLSNQISGVLSNGTAFVESTAPVPLESTPVTLNEPKETPVTATYHLKAQPDPSPILGRLTQHQNAALQSDLPAQARDPVPIPPYDEPSLTLKPHCEPVVTSTEPPQPRNIRPQRRRAPPPSKIPSSAVEMPGSADVSGLNVQFGALDFGSESTVENLNQSESSCQEPVAAPQTQSSLFPKPTAISESLGGLPPAVMESSYPSASLGLPSTTAPPVLAQSSASRVESSATTTLSNGFGEMRTSSVQEAAPSSTHQPISTEKSLSSSSSSTAAPALSTALPSLSSHVSSVNCPGSSAPTSSSLSTQMGSDVNVSLSTYSGAVSAVSSSMVNSNGLNTGTQSLTANGASAPSAVRSAPLQTNITPSSGKAPPNLAQGVPPLLASQYIMGPGGLLPAYPPIYGYEDLQMMQSRLPMDYYGMAFPGTALAGRDGGLANNPYSGEPTKFGSSDSNSPAPASSLSSVPPSQSQQSAGPPQNQGPQNPGQAQQGQTQAFLNPPLPPGYGYTSLPYYPGVPGVPSAFQYGPAVFMPPASTKQHSMGPSSQYQHQAGYGQHTYGQGFDEISQAHAGGDYGKGGYGGSSQAQAKAVNSSGKAPGLSGSASSELTGTMYNKTQSFDKQGFPTAAGPAFSLPSALGGTGPLNPTGAPGYAPAPFLHILPHQQPPSQLLHHHMAQDTQGQRSQANSMQKSQGKSTYSSSPYWAN